LDLFTPMTMLTGSADLEEGKLLILSTEKCCKILISIILNFILMISKIL